MSYLHVIRGYFSCFKNRKKITARMYGGLAGQLLQDLERSGWKVAENQDITRLIQVMGCTTDWNQQYGYPWLQEVDTT